MIRYKQRPLRRKVAAADLCRWQHALAASVWGLLLSACVAAQESDLAADLVERGLVFAPEVQVKLPAPTLNPELVGAARQDALSQLAGKLQWERFVSDAVTAPVAIAIDPVTDARGERLGLLVHHAFVVHSTLDAMHDQRAMAEIFGHPPAAARGASVGDPQAALNESGGPDGADTSELVTRELAEDELRRLGFHEQADSGAKFAYIQLPLLNKVSIRGVIRVEKRERPGSIEFFWRLDPSFNRLESYASRWTRLERNAVGRLVEGASFPYSGCGGYWGAYEISSARSPLLIESRLLIREPQEWFSGSHFLRSKLPALIQENARSFRRHLSDKPT